MHCQLCGITLHEHDQAASAAASADVESGNHLQALQKKVAELIAKNDQFFVADLKEFSVTLATLAKEHHFQDKKNIQTFRAIHAQVLLMLNKPQEAQDPLRHMVWKGTSITQAIKPNVDFHAVIDHIAALGAAVLKIDLSGLWSVKQTEKHLTEEDIHYIGSHLFTKCPNIISLTLNGSDRMAFLKG